MSKQVCLFQTPTLPGKLSKGIRNILLLLSLHYVVFNTIPLYIQSYDFTLTLEKSFLLAIPIYHMRLA